MQSPSVTYSLLGYWTSVAETVPERASVQTRTVMLLSEQLLLRSRTTLLFLFLFLFCNTTEHSWPVDTVPFSFCDAPFHYRYSVNIAFDNHEVLIHRVKAKELVGQIAMNNPSHSLLLKSCITKRKNSNEYILLSCVIPTIACSVLKSYIREWKNSNEYFTTLCNPSHSLLLKSCIREWKNMNEYILLQ